MSFMQNYSNYQRNAIATDLEIGFLILSFLSFSRSQALPGNALLEALPREQTVESNYSVNAFTNSASSHPVCSITLSRTLANSSFRHGF